ncbi:hypothetical protein MY3296_002724 [Beauveria thailandica]
MSTNSYREQVHRAKQYIDSLEEESSSLRDTIKNCRIKSESSAKLIKNLEAKCAEQTAQLSKVYSNAVSNWAQDVSRDMPDDVVRSTISSFFQGDFFSWCADMCAPEIDWSKGHEKILDHCNLVNQQHHYRSGPAHLLFDHAAPDGCSSLVLLQAALAKSLVDAFLRNPYFLLNDGIILQKIESTFAENLANCPFRMNDSYMECEPAVASAPGERLNDRPIGVVIRPCILSESISDSGEEIPPVVWSKALVWVSGKEDPYDMEEDQVTLIQ